MTLLSSTKFLVVYSAIVTAAFAYTVFVGILGSPGALHLKTLTVQRINVVEPNGIPRLIISDQHDFPDVIIKGRDYPLHRHAAGMIFYNNEGTENGGLIFGGYIGKHGHPFTFGHLSFDKYMQDQTFVVNTDQAHGTYVKGLSINDQPNYPITREFRVAAEAQAHPNRAKQIWAAFCKVNGCVRHRIWLGETADKAVSLALFDREGRKRIVLRVGPNGTPELRFLNAGGGVIAQIPATSSGTVAPK
jgi:hypothetical protein